MKRPIAIAAAAAALACAADARQPGPAVKADPAAHSVAFTAKATGIRTADTLEFLAIGPLSSHGYEAMFTTDASPGDIARAMDAAGIPRGVPPDSRKARFWPCGEKVSFKVEVAGKPYSLEDLVSDVAPADEPRVLPSGAVATGGERLPDGTAAASTNEPCAVFALYGSGQSLLALQGRLLQSAAYGRFKPKVEFPAGANAAISISWNGTNTVSRRELSICEIDGKPAASLAPGAAPVPLADALSAIRAERTRGMDVHVAPGFGRAVPLRMAREIAPVFLMLDGNGLKLAGAPEGQPYIQSYIPEESWRERKNRPFQPFEIRIAADGSKTFTFVHEDWSAENATEPKLSPETRKFAQWSEIPAIVKSFGEEAAKTDAALFFMPAGEPLGTFFDGAAAFGGMLDAVYVYAE